MAMKLPAIVSPPVPVKSIPMLHPSMTRPETVLAPALMVRPFRRTGALPLSSSIFRTVFLARQKNWLWSSPTALAAQV
jgi:hypothetical protein